jgi:ribosomal protein S6--L-glutamate ligase
MSFCQPSVACRSLTRMSLGDSSVLAPRFPKAQANFCIKWHTCYINTTQVYIMKLAILSRGLRSYSTRRLKEAALQRGHDVKILDTLKFAIDLQKGVPDLYFRQKMLSNYDAVLPRIGASITYYGTAVVRQFQEMDVFCANTAHGIMNSRDKLRSLQILSRHHVGIPRTTFVSDKKDVLPAIERVGGAPVVIKLIEGTQGIGVLLAETSKSAEGIIELLQSQKQNVLIQKFVAESKGKDIRAFVVGDRVVAAMRRVAQGQEFRSNVHRGGIAERVELDEQYTETAVRAAQILGLQVAGVDMLEGATGPQIMEVNSSPGLEGIETCTGLDVAGAVIDYISAQVDFPEIDIRQRLTVSKGYGVSEIYAPEGSDFVGKTIKETTLAEQDINILTLYRGNKIIPNPKSDRVLEADDKLLCFGKLESMRKMIPSKSRRRRRPKVIDLVSEVADAQHAESPDE